MGILMTIAIILLIFWVGGFALHIAGGLIHLLLIAAIIFFIVGFLRRSAA